MSEIVDAHHQGDNTNVPSKWQDVTEAFQQASKIMQVGEMIHPESFNLYTAMSAIELMNPKMDIGCGTVRNVKDVVLPSHLSDIQLINIMDKLFACEMSWLDAHTLPQTVFSCVYAQRMTESPRVELFSYLRVQLATMDSISNLIVSENVAEEEDFVSWTYGFRLCPLRSGRHEEDDQILADMERQGQLCNITDDQSRPLADAISIRIRFRVQFYSAIQYLSKLSSDYSPPEALKLLKRLEDTMKLWKACPQRHKIDHNLINLIFDSTINRHVMTSTPPRTEPLLDLDAAFDYCQTIITELKALVNLQSLALPSYTQHNKYSDIRTVENPPCSLHIAMHAVESFCARYNPKTLTRSVMSRLMVPEYTYILFEQDRADFIKLVKADMGVSWEHGESEGIEISETLRDGVLYIFKCLCRNRSCQRRQLLQVLRWWDQFGCMYPLNQNAELVPSCAPTALKSCAVATIRHLIEEISEKHGGALEKEDKKISVKEQGDVTVEEFELKEPGDVWKIMSPLQIVSYEIAAHLMVQHWLLGFECDLYQEYEYGTVFLYIGYVLYPISTRSPSSSSLKDVPLHPLKISLNIMDEARFWVCMALYSLLEALSCGDQWKYSCQRAETMPNSASRKYGSEELWYEQRFGIMAGMLNGPAYADYDCIVMFKNCLEESLRCNEEERDIIVLHLKAAKRAFRKSRMVLQEAKRATADCSKNVVIDDILTIASVAVENELVTSEVLQSYVKEKSCGESSKLYNVSFKFNRHRHFPVLKVKEEK